MKCPSCNRFAAYDTGEEPEVNVEVESELLKMTGVGEDEKNDPDRATAMVSGDCRIVLKAECCGEELKEANFEISDVELEIARAEGCTCDLTDLSVEASGEISDRNEMQSKRTKKDGTVVVKAVPYRYQKRFFGAQLTIEVSCECGKTTATEDWADEVQASSMDELV